MHKRLIIISCIILAAVTGILVFLIACSNDVEIGTIVNVFSGMDDTYPVLVGVSSASSSVICIEFSEPVRVFENSFDPFVARADGKYVYVTLNRSLPPGVMSEISGRVRDYCGNTTGFTVKVWGFNPRMPKILINEFTTKGTEKSPDRTELLVLEDGNINGLSLYCGIPDDYDSKMVFEDIEVKKGDMLVVWWTNSLPEPVSSDSVLGIYNYCAESGEGASSNNGTMVLCSTPSIGASILDAVVYSNFTSSHEGFGTRTAKERAQWVLESGAWDGDAVDSTTSTATRSICRVMDSEDTDSSSDWYVTVTGGSTFGNPNTSESY